MESMASKLEIESKYGRIYQMDIAGRLVNFSEQSMARYYSSKKHLIYETRKKQFYLYTPDNGTWAGISNEEVLSDLDLFLHECAKEWDVPQLESKRKLPVLNSLLKYVRVAVKESNFFKRGSGAYVHCANGMVVWDEIARDWELRPFAPDYRSRYASPIHYHPEAKAHRFLTELLEPLIYEDDFELIQRYLGQCVVGCNPTQTILLITGSGGSGKGQLANIVELLVGEGSFTQIRPESIAGRFETSFFLGKTLLSGKESNSSFFTTKGMQTLKDLVGDDKMRAEKKGSNEEFMFEGVFNMFIVGNTIPTMEFESNDDRSAWERRIRWVRCKNSRPEKRINHFADVLFREEGSGILNWALSGAKKTLIADSSELICTANQKHRLDYLFAAARPLDLFLTETVEKAAGVSITGEEMYRVFSEFVMETGMSPWNQRKFQNELPLAMMRHFQAPLRHDIPRPNMTTGKMTNRTGYANVRFK